MKMTIFSFLSFMKNAGFLKQHGSKRGPYKSSTTQAVNKRQGQAFTRTKC